MKLKPEVTSSRPFKDRKSKVRDVKSIAAAVMIEKMNGGDDVVEITEDDRNETDDVKTSNVTSSTSECNVISSDDVIAEGGAAVVLKCNDVERQSNESGKGGDETTTTVVVDGGGGKHSWIGWGSDENTVTGMDSNATTSGPVDRKLKSILKRTSGSTSKRRISFNDTMTVFSDTFGTCVLAMRCDDEDDDVGDDIYVAYEPPLEYQDCVDFEPPKEYQDERFESESECSSLVKTVEQSCPTSVTDGSSESSDETVTNDKMINQTDKETSVVVVVVVGGDDADENEAKCLLTEENLKQHEIMMKTETEIVEDLSAVEGDEKYLSPPLKQLSVHVAASQPPPPGDDWQVELSPLNSGSIPETESDSSVSSQDTIILMTSEESKRNAEHIKESLKIYETLKKTDSSSLSSSGSDETKSSGIESETQSSSDTTNSSQGSISTGWTSEDIRRVIERNAMRRSMQRYAETRRKQQNQRRTDEKSSSLSDRIKLLTCTDDDGGDSGVDLEKNASDYAPMLSNKLSGSMDLTMHHRQQNDNLTSRQRHSLASHGYISPLSGTLYHRTVPPKLMNRACTTLPVTGRVQTALINRSNSDTYVSRDNFSGVGYRSDDLESSRRGRCDSSCVDLGIEPNRFVKLADGGVDELELFVKQDSDRIDRIKQRYSYCEGEVNESITTDPNFNRRPSVRGIKPRFGSTNEILQQMQHQIQPPVYASPKNVGSHVTWPYRDQTCQGVRTLPLVVEESTSIGGGGDVLRSKRGRENIKSFNRTFADERGTPEGASSSPKVSSDPLYPSTQNSEKAERNDDGIIYYAMNV
ncbi:Uncharacterised protein g4417 [Pycnogonum litorale]